MKVKLLKVMLNGVSDECELTVDQIDDYKVNLVLGDDDNSKISLGPVDFVPKGEAA